MYRLPFFLVEMVMIVSNLYVSIINEISYSKNNDNESECEQIGLRIW